MDIKNHATLPTDLVSYWRLDGDGNDAHDGHNGTVNGPTVTNDGKIGQGYTFDSSNDYITLGTHVDFEMTLLSISAWVKFNPSYASRKVIAKRNNTTIQWSLELSSSSPYKMQFVAKVGGVVYTITEDASGASAWHHYVATFDGSYLRLYKDGAPAATPVAASGTIDSSAAMPVLFGARCANGVLTPGADWFYGTLDEVGIWKRALSDAEVLDLFAAGGGLSYENLDRGVASAKELVELFSKISLPGAVEPEQAPNSIAIGAAGIFEVPEGFKCCGPLIPEVAPASLNQGVANTLKVRRRG